jgi:hypothetical protein
MTKIAGSGSRSISQRHGSADPDPHQNVMDPEHCLPYIEKGKAKRERGGGVVITVVLADGEGGDLNLTTAINPGLLYLFLFRKTFYLFVTSSIGFFFMHMVE